MPKHVKPSDTAKDWNDLEQGDSISTTAVTVTESHLVNWAGLTGDIVQFHLDEEFAQSTQFGARIAHGPLTMALAVGLSTQTGYLSNVLAWLGLDNLKALKPVFIDDTLHATITLVEKSETSKPHRGVWVLEYSVMNQHEDTVMTFVSRLLLSRHSQ